MVIQYFHDLSGPVLLNECLVITSWQETQTAGNGLLSCPIILIINYN